MRDGTAGGGGGSSGDGDDSDDGKRRNLINLSALLFLILLVAGSVWLVQLLSKKSRLEDCLMSGRTNCNPIEPTR